MTLTTLIPLAIALVGPLLAYLATVRRLSGKISSSAAEDLWAESRSIREDLQARNAFLTDKIVALEKRIEDLEERNRALYKENGNLTRTVEGHERTIRALTDEVHDLHVENRRLRAENERLQTRVKELEDHNAE